jgi:hypothetical protein
MRIHSLVLIGSHSAAETSLCAGARRADRESTRKEPTATNLVPCLQKKRKLRPRTADDGQWSSMELAVLYTAIRSRSPRRARPYACNPPFNKTHARLNGHPRRFNALQRSAAHRPNLQQHGNFYKCKYERQNCTNMENVKILHRVACQMAQTATYSRAAWPMRYKSALQAALNALKLSAVLAILHNGQLNSVFTMIELIFETPIGNNLCRFSGSNYPVRLKHTFVQRQGAAT